MRLRLPALFCLVFLPAALCLHCFKSDDIPARILVFSKTAGYRHDCIPVATAALRKICAENGIAMDTSEEAEVFTEKNLKRYNAVVFLCTTGDVLDPAQETDFERYMQAGGGFAGIHSATDTEYGWTWFGGLVGAYFNGHPQIQDAILHVKDHKHPATAHLGDRWQRRDEWYNFKDLNPNVNVLLAIDENTYQGGTNGDNHPMSWHHEFDGGRAFYTALGHTKESYSEPDFLKHLLGGIKFAIGKKKRLDYTKCRTPANPDPTRFVKTVLASDLAEPMQFGMLPGGKIILIERRGAIKIYNPTTGLINTVRKLPVFSDQEDGLLGLAIDPDWEKNHWIYLYYSPPGVEAVNQLSRFVFAGDSLDRASEKIILKVPVNREECCHAAGCLRFSDDGYLFLSTGDNTNPFASDGYAPIDERKGRASWDAQRSSANTMDLRGKILRIKVHDDGTYTCPAGNLFVKEDVHVAPPGPPAGGERSAAPGIAAKGKNNASPPHGGEGNVSPGIILKDKSSAPLPPSGGPGRAPGIAANGKHNASPPHGGERNVSPGIILKDKSSAPLPPSGGAPEIYVMGCRNPFRMSVDDRRKLLFWGEVGPDAGEPDSARGPAGYDEINRARTAGFFGWPYFVGDNKAYRDYDFARKKSGPRFDPMHPFNDSPNNTGARALPPAQPAFIWYPYDNSPEFPLTGNGGRNAMAGPVYYCDEYPEQTRFPEYYDGKLITYDWIRNWMMAVTIDSLGNFSRMEPFGDSIRLSRPMDMLVAPDGAVWVLEYGTQWYSSNPDARLSRIDYVRGNRSPIPVLQADRVAGAALLRVVFSASKTRDYDGDRLSFEVNFGDGSESRRINAGRLTAWSAKGASRRPSVALDSIAYVFEKPGIYEVTLKVRDEQGQISTCHQKISVGNEPPLVHWDFGGRNRSFYHPGDTLKYKIVVNDLEDGSIENGGIAPEFVAATIDYLETGFDITSIAHGHQSARQQTEYAKGKTLVERSDCKTCHAEDRRINGPAYQAIAERYRNNDFAVRNLSGKIIRGGAGNWGQSVMSAHPQTTEEEAGEMARWILSLGAPKKEIKSFPVSGHYALAVPGPKTKREKPRAGTFILKATYRDRGSDTQTPIESGETLVLRAAFQQAEQADSMSKSIRTYRPFGGDTVVLNELKNNNFFVFKHADLRGVHSISIGVGLGDKKYNFAGGRIELRLDSPAGPLAGKIDVPAKKIPDKMAFSEIVLPVNVPPDGRFHDLYFVVKNENNPARAVTAIDWVRVNL